VKRPPPTNHTPYDIPYWDLGWTFLENNFVSPFLNFFFCVRGTFLKRTFLKKEPSSKENLSKENIHQKSIVLLNFPGRNMNINLGNNGETQVFNAALTGQTALLRLLIKAECDVNQANDDGATPAFAAAHYGYTAALELLVAAGCDVNLADKVGTTPAQIAIYRGHTTALEFIVKAPGFDVDLADKNGFTPAHDAASFGRISALKLLVNAGSDMNRPAKDGMTPARITALKDSMAKSERKLEKKNNKKMKKGNNKKKKSKAPRAKTAAKVESQRFAADITPTIVFAADITPTIVGDYDDVESDDEEVELCQCVHCLQDDRSKELRFTQFVISELFHARST
jgi:hypothetical protein